MTTHPGVSRMLQLRPSDLCVNDGPLRPQKDFPSASVVKKKNPPAKQEMWV